MVDWFTGLYESLVGFLSWIAAWLQNAFDPASWLLWLLEILPTESPTTVALFDQVGSFVQSAAGAIYVFNLAIDLPALGVILGAILFIELALAVVWVWRGLLSLIPVA